MAAAIIMTMVGMEAMPTTRVAMAVITCDSENWGIVVGGGKPQWRNIDRGDNNN